MVPGFSTGNVSVLNQSLFPDNLPTGHSFLKFQVWTWVSKEKKTKSHRSVVVKLRPGHWCSLEKLTSVLGSADEQEKMEKG